MGAEGGKCPPGPTGALDKGLIPNGPASHCFLSLENGLPGLYQNPLPGNSLVVQWLGSHTITAKGTGSTPSQGSKIPQAPWPGQNQTKKNNKSPSSFPSSGDVLVIADIRAEGGQ